LLIDADLCSFVLERLDTAIGAARAGASPAPAGAPATKSAAAGMLSGQSSPAGAEPL